MSFTTKDLQARLLTSLNEDSVAARNSVARIASAMIATKQLEMNSTNPDAPAVTLIEDAAA